jgi:L-fuconolactonase
MTAAEPDGSPPNPRPVRRVVDAHVHHWDPARTDWYPYLAGGGSPGGEGSSRGPGMRRRFDRLTYLSEAASWHVEKYVHVTAAKGTAHFLTETREREAEAQATGQPNAIVGTIDPTAPVSAALGQLAAQRAATRFRGLRVTEGMDHASATGRAILAALADGGLVYDLVTHPDAMRGAARQLGRYGQLTVVIEHTGWPLSADPAHLKTWRDGMTALAELGDRVHCKLSGLAMTLERIETGAFRPWIEFCLDLFGPGRCLFASNFPVDSNFGTFDDLYGVYDRLTRHLSDSDRAALFADNAERIYRC